MSFASLLLSATCLLAPVDAPIVDRFREPPCTYCAGNRGLEYATVAGGPVHAAERGVVTFAGAVGSVRYVVVEQPNRWLATYGKLAEIDVRRGQTVVQGQRLGTTAATFYFGLRDGERYIDPEPLLASIVRRVHLVPLDGARRRPGPAPRIVCPSARRSVAAAGQRR